ncbi:MAG: methionyl-tRNA formyltransferase [Bacteroidaceae bacterium]|nr:methionyl-tRNA formyltransferase [Bacteroidaceae bacterium]
MAEKLRIVYIGTPDFAVEPLRSLRNLEKCDTDCGYTIVGVVTMPDRIITRRGSNQVLMSPVKEYALAENLPLLQPESLKDETFIEELASWKADLQIVVAFRMLPEKVWNMPRLGTFNLHASLLPQYRGAAPINWAIINGDKESGVTTFFLKHEIDTGDVIMQRKVEITETDDAGTLHDKLMFIGSETVVDTVLSIVRGEAVARTQASIFDGELRPAPKIFRDTCRIDWNKGCEELYNFVRGLSPYPAAWTDLTDGEGNITTIKVYETKKEICQVNESIGTILSDGKSYIKVAIADGYLHLTSLQIPGKKRMPVADLLRGFSIEGKKIAL